MAKVGINGFGRIGRLFLRIAAQEGDLDVVAVNSTADPKTLCHLFRYDSVHGSFLDASYDDEHLIVKGKKIKVTNYSKPSEIPWKDLGVDYVVEGTGKFRSRKDAQGHIDSGAKRVVITAPGKDPDITIVMGVNEKEYDPSKHRIISAASCTTNCLAPVAKVLLDNFGIEKGFMTTIHAYTNDQRVLDKTHKDLRRARAAALSMIPTTTGAATAVSLVLPELKGKLDGFAVRVPTPNVSLVDLTCILSRNTTKEEINEAMKRASEGELKGIMAYTEEPLVSVDFNHTPYSAIVDGLLTEVIQGNLAKVVAWYDNEWGYAYRIYDLLKYMEGREDV